MSRNISSFKYKIKGPSIIKGKIDISGNKNAALPCLVASILTDEEVVLKNIPEIEDVFVTFKILESIGSTITKMSKGTYKIKLTDIKNSNISEELSSLLRASILFSGALAARAGHSSIYPPGGDVIGKRRLDTHFFALSMLGYKIDLKDNFIFEKTKDTRGKEIFLDEASVTGTENAIMAAVLLQGETVIENAACEPHVKDLCNMLNSMGAKIEGIGSNILKIEGVSKLHGTEFAIGPDFMEVGSFVGLAACNDGELELCKVNFKDLKMIRLCFNKIGIDWQEDGKDTIFIKKGQKKTVVKDFQNRIPKVESFLWPGFPTDLMSVFITTATQVKGTVLVHEKMFESRMFFVDKLISMGANIVLCDPHRAIIIGPTPLRAQELSSPDVRAGMSLLLAAICADGVSTINNVYQIERGYENIHQRLADLGADIVRIESDKNNN